MRVRALITAAAALTLAGCGAEAASAPAVPPSAPTVTVTPPAASAAPAVSTAPTPTRAHVRLVKIPAVVGKNHQLAQNTMQAAGLYMLREKDATGQGRLLIWDRNWVVVRQNPPAGRRVTPDTVITLYSKKIGE
jgi:PASTA domain-containing protein